MSTQLSELELRYPRILDSIVLMWGYGELDGYLERLLFADRKRDGFPPEVMEELMMLQLLHANRETPAELKLV
jgi:hypothetical protein